MKLKLSLLALLCSAGSVMAESAPKNIIYMIGDGMIRRTQLHIVTLKMIQILKLLTQLFSILFCVVWHIPTLTIIPM